MCNHKAMRPFLKRAIACLNSFSISVSRLMTYALFRESEPFIERTKLLEVLNVKHMKDCTDAVACETSKITSPRACSPTARRPVLFTSLLSRASGNGHSLPATRHVNTSSRIGQVRESSRSEHPSDISFSLTTRSLCQLDLFFLLFFFLSASFYSLASVRRSNKVNSLGGASERGVPRVLQRLRYSSVIAFLRALFSRTANPRTRYDETETKSCSDNFGKSLSKIFYDTLSNS